MNPKRLAVFVLATLLIPVLPPGRAFAANPQGQGDNQEALRTAMVLSFLHQANLREIDMAGIVKARSDSSQAVTSFADRLISDHKRMDQQILDFANRRGMTLDAAAEQTKREVERTWEDRRVKGVGSATGEWAFTAEPNIDPDIAHLAMTKFKTSLEKLRTLNGSAFEPRIRPDGTGRSPDGHRPGHECSQADHGSRSLRAHRQAAAGLSRSDEDGAEDAGEDREAVAP